jgi:hypothetical protein
MGTKERRQYPNIHLTARHQLTQASSDKYPMVDLSLFGNRLLNVSIFIRIGLRHAV